MSLFLYNLSIFIYITLARVFAFLGNSKAKKFIAGRKNIFKEIEQKINTKNAQRAWFHCASLGEFEQARPVIERFKAKFPNYYIILTFFSPSGYEVSKNYATADAIFYLPTDTKANAKRFLDLIKPTIILFVKYEFWYHYLSEAHQRHIPIIGFSVILRPSQLFFKWYGGFYSKILYFFEHFFVQNEQTQSLLKSINITETTLAGDTRFDRVNEIAQQIKPLTEIEQFKANKQLLVVGSAWEKDLDLIVPFVNKQPAELKIIIAPHEIYESKIEALKQSIKATVVRYSDIIPDTKLSDYQVLIVDNIGMLTRIYQYADFAFVGGSFQRGLHNVLEPATFGMPIFFGDKNYKKFQEALDLLELQVAFKVKNQSEFEQLFHQIRSDKKQYEAILQSCKRYINKNIGSEKRILSYLEEKVRQISEM